MKNKPQNPDKPAPKPFEFAEVVEVATGERRRVPVDPRLGQTLDRWLAKKVDGQPQFVLPPKAE